MIVIVDYGMGNLRSVFSAFSLFDRTIVTSDGEKILKGDKLVIPGVGNFGRAIKNLEELDLKQAIIEFIKSGKYVIGICLGLQILFEESEEAPGVKGLSILKGKVKHLSKINRKIIPNIGWQKTKIQGKIFDGLKDEEYFYYIHSYFVDNIDGEKIADAGFCAGIHYENIYAFQFHPEKSQKVGLKIIENFSKLQ